MRLRLIKIARIVLSVQPREARNSANSGQERRELPEGAKVFLSLGVARSAVTNFRNLTLMKHGVILGQNRLKIAFLREIQRGSTVRNSCGNDDKVSGCRKGLKMQKATANGRKSYQTGNQLTASEKDTKLLTYRDI